MSNKFYLVLAAVFAVSAIYFFGSKPHYSLFSMLGLGFCFYKGH